MVRTFDAAVAAMCSSIPAVVLAQFLDQLPGSGTSAVQVVVLPLAETAAVVLFASAGYVFRRLPHAAGGGGGNRRLSELVTFSLCVSVGVLQYVVFVQPPEEGVVINIDVRSLGLGAARALPAAAAAAFFLGMALVFAQVRAGGGGDHGGAVLILSNVALGAAAVVVALMAMAALYTAY